MSPIPLYENVESALAAGIADGTMPPGTQLPPEEGLIERFKVSRTTVRKYYDQYREGNGLPRRCDNPACCFHTGELVWNGKELRLTLDHIKGVSRGNRPKNLQLLCPNCESQTHTRGGKNKGRVVMSTYLGALRRQRVPLEEP